MIQHFQAGVSEPVLTYLKAKAIAEARSLSNLAGKILSEFVAKQRQSSDRPEEALEVE